MFVLFIDTLCLCFHVRIVKKNLEIKLHRFSGVHIRDGCQNGSAVYFSCRNDALSKFAHKTSDVNYRYF